MIHKDGQDFIEASDYAPIKKLYEAAVRDGRDAFVYEGRELVTSYAKYLLEYMASRGADKKGAGR